MTKTQIVLFERCPLCGKAKITMESRKRFLFSKAKINPCPTCSAEFGFRGVDSFQLLFCEPHRLVGRHDCRERVFRGCYLGATFSKREWQEIANGGESVAFSKFLEMSANLRQGLLPTYPSEGLSLSLDKGEVVHYVSSPVYLNEKQSSYGKTSDCGEFILTNKRIVFVRQRGMFSIPLERVELVEDCPPGFLIREKERFEPHFFFPPKYDPLAAAVEGAIHNFKRRN
jgi:hypothetical protein